MNRWFGLQKKWGFRRNYEYNLFIDQKELFSGALFSVGAERLTENVDAVGQVMENKCSLSNSESLQKFSQSALGHQPIGKGYRNEGMR